MDVRKEVVDLEEGIKGGSNRKKVKVNIMLVMD